MCRWVVFLLLLGCGTGKDIKETTEVKSRTTELEKVTVKETITPPMDVAIFVPEVAGRIEDFRQKINTPTGSFTIEKNKTGLKVEVLQEETRQKDSTYIAKNQKETSNNKEYKEVKKVVRWNNFQLFLLLFFVVIVVYYLYKIFKFLKLI